VAVRKPAAIQQLSGASNHAESCPGTIGPISFEVKQTGERNARNWHRKMLGELGYVDGENIVFEYRWSHQAQRLPTFAAELTDLKMDVIVTADPTNLHCQQSRESAV
jgi:hypothetical protein